jgi:ubiquinone/menaquinone biosynthesis C-methylase UbiE
MSHELLANTFDQWAARGMDAKMERGHGDVVAQVLARMNVRHGEQILDLGCGNGWATRLLARSGPGVSAIGVDVSPQMVARAEELHSLTIRARYEIAPFEKLPFGDAKFDRAFSMEALYYAVDVDRALAEAFRVLKPGGRFAVSDVVVRGEVPAAIRRSVELWIGCVAGALEENEYREKLAKAGFEEIDVEPTRVYRAEDAREFLAGTGLDADVIAPQVDGKFLSAFVRARKPAA